MLTTRTRGARAPWVGSPAPAMATAPANDASTAAQLDSVLTRLALTEEAALARVLSALLPRLLAQVRGAGRGKTIAAAAALPPHALRLALAVAEGLRQGGAGAPRSSWAAGVEMV